MSFEQKIANRIMSRVMDGGGAATGEVGVDAAYLNGYRAAVADMAGGWLSGDAMQLARDIRVQLGLLRDRHRRGDEQAVDSVFRAIEALADDPAFGTLTQREQRLFCAVATA